MFVSRENSQKRYDICKSCENFTVVKTCKLCGCFMPLKVTIAGSSCPATKWIPIQGDPEIKERYKVDDQ